MLKVFMLLKTRAMIFFKQTILRVCYYCHYKFVHKNCLVKMIVNINAFLVLVKDMAKQDIQHS